MPVNRAGLLRAVVDDPDFGGLDEFGVAVANAGMKSGESGSVTAATNSTIDCLAVVSRQPGSSSVLIARLLRLMLILALIG